MKPEFKLNGNRGWITVGVFLTVQTFGAGWWASGISTDVVHIKKDIESTRVAIEKIEDRYEKELKERLKEMQDVSRMHRALSKN